MVSVLSLALGAMILPPSVGKDASQLKSAVSVRAQFTLSGGTNRYCVTLKLVGRV
jgi:hypothetical protein